MDFLFFLQNIGKFRIIPHSSATAQFRWNSVFLILREVIALEVPKTIREIFTLVGYCMTSKTSDTSFLEVSINNLFGSVHITFIEFVEHLTKNISIGVGITLLAGQVAIKLFLRDTKNILIGVSCQLSNVTAVTGHI